MIVPVFGQVVVVVVWVVFMFPVAQLQVPESGSTANLHRIWLLHCFRLVYSGQI